MRFYTLPPSYDIEYPYLCAPIHKWRALLKRKWEHAIIDCGVLIFKKEKVKEYPKWFLNSYHFKAKSLTEIFKGRVWVVIPDYPDDYNPGAIHDSVEKTLANMERFVRLGGVNWLPSIQSKFLDIDSFIDSCKRTREIIKKDYPRVAIGTICKTNNLAFIKKCCRIARAYFPNSWIHAFGLGLKALPFVKHLLDSFDTMAWTFPRSPWLSCKNLLKAREYFKAYIKKVEEKLKTPQTLVTDFL